MTDQQLNVVPPADRVVLSGIRFDRLTETDVVERVLDDLSGGRGGSIVTPNVDILRTVRRDAAARRHVRTATYVVADGAPLVWASRLRGTALPERVAGSSLIWSLSEALGTQARSVYLLGGAPGMAERAGAVLRERCPGLRLAGTDCPPLGFENDPQALAQVCAAVVGAEPDVVYVGLGFPKQENLIARLTPLLPRSWFIGCGAAITFVAGGQRRAPAWMQRTGLEWFHRLCREPRRLFRRYVVHDAPFALALLASSALRRR